MATLELSYVWDTAIEFDIKKLSYLQLWKAQRLRELQ